MKSQAAHDIEEYLGEGRRARAGAESRLDAGVAAERELPAPAEAAVALNGLHDTLREALGAQAAAVVPLLGSVHRSLCALIPGYPTELAREELLGFAPPPARTLDELDAQLNRLEDVLLQLVPSAEGRR